MKTLLEQRAENVSPITRPEKPPSDRVEVGIGRGEAGQNKANGLERSDDGVGEIECDCLSIREALVSVGCYVGQSFKS